MTRFRTILLAVAAFAAFALVPDSVFAQDQQNQGCFLCDLSSCQPGEHWDTHWFLSNNLHGNMHGPGCVTGGCVHSAYSGSAAIIREAKEAFALGTDEALARLLDADPRVALVLERRAIQVYTETGEVAFHLPIPLELATRLDKLILNRNLAAR